MSIVLNEKKWAQDAINSNCLGGNQIETLTRVARYYISDGDSKSTTKKKLGEFVLKCEPSASLVKWDDTLDKIVKYASKYPSRNISEIRVTNGELKAISTLDGKQLRRLAFVLLCVSKYWDAVLPQNDHWVNTTDSDIVKMSNINTSIRRQSQMFSKLYDAGLISFSRKVDNLNVRVLFSEDGTDGVLIDDFRNLGYQYMMLCGEPYFRCDNCGITVRINNPSRGRKQKYCDECAAAIGMKQRVDWVMRNRTYVKKQKC